MAHSPRERACWICCRRRGSASFLEVKACRGNSLPGRSRISPNYFDNIQNALCAGKLEIAGGIPSSNPQFWLCPGWKSSRGNSQQSRRFRVLTTSTSHLIPPHGGDLMQLVASAEPSAELKAHSREWPSWDLTARQLCDLELLLSGGFSPLRGFMKRADYERVCHNMHLASGVLWPMPITLDVTEEFAKKLQPGTSKIALRDPEGVMLAVLDVEEVWQPDRKAEAESVFGTNSAVHPGVDYVLNKANPWYVGGKLEGVQAPSHYDFKTLRLTPAELRTEFARLGWRRVVAFQTRNPMHRAHVE